MSWLSIFLAQFWLQVSNPGRPCSWHPPSVGQMAILDRQHSWQWRCHRPLGLDEWPWFLGAMFCCSIFLVVCSCIRLLCVQLVPVGETWPPHHLFKVSETPQGQDPLIGTPGGMKAKPLSCCAKGQQVINLDRDADMQSSLSTWHCSIKLRYCTDVNAFKNTHVYILGKNRPIVRISQENYHSKPSWLENRQLISNKHTQTRCRRFKNQQGANMPQFSFSNLQLGQHFWSISLLRAGAQSEDVRHEGERSDEAEGQVLAIWATTDFGQLLFFRKEWLQHFSGFSTSQFCKKWIWYNIDQKTDNNG